MSDAHDGDGADHRSPTPQPAPSSTSSTDASFGDDDDDDDAVDFSSTSSSMAGVAASAHVAPRCCDASDELNATPRSDGAAAAEGDVPPSTAHVAPMTAGLVNEGCTCYLNSLLQLLFHTDAFRDAVYHTPVGERQKVAEALQHLFAHLQVRPTPARTTRLTDAFGWDAASLGVQHDIQEMAVLLRDHLERCMKGSPVEGVIAHLFEGDGEQFVETVDKSFVSSRWDAFYEIHLPLNGHTTLLESLTSLTAREQLTGDNKYWLERDGQPGVYRDAERFYVFRRFPRVMWFHLKRIAIDVHSPRLSVRKINRRLEFPLELDLTALEQSVAEDDTATTHPRRRPNGPALYDLHGVIVHRGTVSSGHYYCYIRAYDPVQGRFTHWLEFEDEKVRVVGEEVAVRANYGGAPPHSTHHGDGAASMSNASAYILSYVRRADAATVLAPCPRESIPASILDAVEQEVARELRQQQRALALKQQLTLHVFTDRSLAHYCGVCQSELFAHEGAEMTRYAVCTLRLRKTDAVSVAYEALAAQPSLHRVGVTTTNCRLWRWQWCGRAPRVGGRPTRLRPLCNYVECQARRVSFHAFLFPDELEGAAVVPVYVQPTTATSPSPFAPLHQLREPRVDSEGFAVVSLAAPLLLGGLCITLSNPRVGRCGVELGITTVQEQLVRKVCTVREGAVYIALHRPQLVRGVRVRCSAPSHDHASTSSRSDGDRASVCGRRGTATTSSGSSHSDSDAAKIGVEAVRLDLAHHRLLSPTETLAKDAKARMLCDATDGVLLFFKYFDPPTSTVRYVGSILLDRAAALRSCETVLMQLLGLPVDGVVLDSSGAVCEGGVETGFLRFHEESGGALVRALSASAAIATLRLHSGGVVVAESVDTDSLLTHVQVENYYHTIAAVVQVRLLEVVSSIHDNAAAVHAELLRQLQQRARVVDAVDPTRAEDRAVDPFSTTVPLLHVRERRVAQTEVCRMDGSWTYEMICDAIGRCVGINPACLLLYENVGTREPCPAADPVNAEDGRLTLRNLCDTSNYGVHAVLFFERTTEPYVLASRCCRLNVLLRDRVGHALVKDQYVLCRQDATLEGLVRAVRQTASAWQFPDPLREAVRDAVTASHYVVLCVDRHKPLIRLIAEHDTGAETTSRERDTLRELWLARYDVELVPVSALQPGELRVACCHGEYPELDGMLHGRPFFITISRQTMVGDALEMMLRVTHVPREELCAQSHLRVMMLAEQCLWFNEWNQYLYLYWTNPSNAGEHVPSLMLNHPRPREKPGSRYVAPNDPALRIRNP